MLTMSSNPSTAKKPKPKQQQQKTQQQQQQQNIHRRKRKRGTFALVKADHIQLHQLLYFSPQRIELILAELAIGVQLAIAENSWTVLSVFSIPLSLLPEFPFTA
jgi:hypothetical protein